LLAKKKKKNYSRFLIPLGNFDLSFMGLSLYLTVPYLLTKVPKTLMGLFYVNRKKGQTLPTVELNSTASFYKW